MTKLFNEKTSIIILTTLIAILSIFIPMQPNIFDNMLGIAIIFSLLLFSFSLFPKFRELIMYNSSILTVFILFQFFLNISFANLIFNNKANTLIIFKHLNSSFNNYHILTMIIFLFLTPFVFLLIKTVKKTSEITNEFKTDSFNIKSSTIDADLNSGAITLNEADKRRLTIKNELHYFSKMKIVCKYLFLNYISLEIIGIISFIAGAIIYNHKSEFLSYAFSIIVDNCCLAIPIIFLDLASGVVITNNSMEYSKCC